LRRGLRPAPAAGGRWIVRAGAVDEWHRAGAARGGTRGGDRAAPARGPGHPLPRAGLRLPGAPAHDRDPLADAAPPGTRERGPAALGRVGRDLPPHGRGRIRGGATRRRAAPRLPGADRAGPRPIEVAVASTTRATLLRRLRDPRDAGAWAEFFDLYAPLLESYARSQDLSHADAEEIRDQCLAVVAQRMSEFEYDRSRGAFRG